MTPASRTVAFVVLAVAAAPVRADETENNKTQAVRSPEQPVLLLAVPRGESTLLGGSFLVSSADRPWWHWLGSGPRWDIAAEEVARVRKEVAAAPLFGPGVVYECKARWVVHGVHPVSGLWTLHVTSSPRRLEVEGKWWREVKIAGGPRRHQPGLWESKGTLSSSYLWLLEKGKDVRELAGEYARLSAELKKAKVRSRETALAVAAKDSDKFVPQRVEVLLLDRAVVDQPGFVERGELIWVIVYQAGDGQGGKGAAWTSISINAHTAVAVSDINQKPRSLARYLPPAEDD
jgi:hypothetical protein